MRGIDCKPKDCHRSNDWRNTDGKGAKNIGICPCDIRRCIGGYHRYVDDESGRIQGRCTKYVELSNASTGSYGCFQRMRDASKRLSGSDMDSSQRTEHMRYGYNYTRSGLAKTLLRIRRDEGRIPAIRYLQYVRLSGNYPMLLQRGRVRM